MKQSTSIKAVLYSMTIMSLFSCTQDANKQTLNPLLRESSQIVSTRPQNSKYFIGVLKLKNPSLLQSAERVDGKPATDKALLKAVTEEQEEAIKALKNISSEIQVLYRYKMVLNGLAVLAPNELADKIRGLGQIAYAEGSGNFARPITLDTPVKINEAIKERNSLKFIGAEALHQKGITGKGVKVGIIDTGIDYTHSMFKGVGTVEGYKAINPSAEAVGFPSEKVVGGLDLVGTEFDSASPDFAKHIPKPDMNPLDEAGHGTHVAGTVAGVGDGLASYDGMAPDAALYAVKVFGAEGSTSDPVVIAALEYSADPNADGDASDKLDVVNMSLGSGYGNPHILYAEAIKNLVRGGVVVVASAGNSGPMDYIVGAPSTSDEALSVAASIDNGDQNWKFTASKIMLGSEELNVEAMEAATTKPIKEAGHVTGELVYMGQATEDFTPEQKAAVNGKVALIDRGVVTFNDKVKRAAEAGAIGVVVANNKPDAAFGMGTTDDFKIPAIMITLEAGNKIKAAQKAGLSTTIDFLSEVKIEKPELVDTLTSFSSKGPRSMDGAIKPEISAPGSNVISAKMGGGQAVVQMSGTSMAAPHMAGVVALVKQAQPDLTTEELKNVVMGTSKTIGAKGKDYPVSLQGAGRVQADKAALSALVAEEPSISVGETAIETKKTVRRTLNLRNLSDANLELSVVLEASEYVSMSAPATVVVKAKTVTEVPLTLSFDATKMKDESIREMDGFIKFKKAGEEVYRIPVLAVAHRLSAVVASELKVEATSNRDGAGAAASLKLKNANTNAGEALLFNVLGRDERKPAAPSYMAADCDLQLAGYRILTKKNQQNQDEDVLQVAVKTFKPMTTWNSCDVSLLIDADGDGVADQELLGANLKTIPNQKEETFATTLLDAAKARELRKAFEAAVKEANGDPKKLEALKDKEKYDEAILDQRELKLYNNSTVVVLEAAISNLAKTKEGTLAFKLLTSHNDQASVEFDDYLGSSVKRLSLKKEDQSFVELPEVLKLKGGETQSVSLTKGAGDDKLLVLMPQNQFSFSDLATDSQAQILKAKYK